MILTVTYIICLTNEMFLQDTWVVNNSRADANPLEYDQLSPTFLMVLFTFLFQATRTGTS